MMRERGTALLEIIIIGFATVLMVLPALTAVARMSEANAQAHSVARDGAVWVARHGGEPPPADGVAVSIERTEGVVEVTAVLEVELVGVAGTGLTRTVSSTVAIPMSAYRSAR